MTVPLQPPRMRQGGVTLIEVLVTVLILAFGILGLIGMTVKVQAAQTDAYQRAQAILLVQDMANRIQANRTAALTYVTGNTPLGTGDAQDASCAGKTGKNLDHCEWSNALKGAAEQLGGASAGAMISARGCIARTGTNPTIMQVTVTWEGITELVGPSLTCGTGLYTSEAKRRAISATVTLGCPTAPSTACAWD
jgi:type IV pilus assembly protein PilV